MSRRRAAITCIVLSCLAGPTAGLASSPPFELRSTIVFTSTRDNPTIDPFEAAEIYLIDPDGSNPRRLTNNTSAEAFASLSPDGKRIVFDSNRDRAAGEPDNVSDLYLMKADGSGQEHIIRGSSATWSPNGRSIAYQASASGTGTPIRPDLGSPTTDSDIFSLNLGDYFEGNGSPRNLTNSPGMIERDPDWSPDGSTIVFVRHPVGVPDLAEIYRMNADGTGLTPLTLQFGEERAPSWSPDGSRIVYMARRGGADFEIAVIDAAGVHEFLLTNNGLPDGTPSWSPDGQWIVFHRPDASGFNQLWTLHFAGGGEVPITTGPGFNVIADWGVLRVHTPPGLATGEIGAEASEVGAGKLADEGRMSLRLDPVHPNPSKTGANLSFAVPATGQVRLTVYDAAGRRVATVLEATMPAGRRTVTWNGRDRQGHPVPAGMYFAKLEAGGEAQVRKIVLAR